MQFPQTGNRLCIETNNSAIEEIFLVCHKRSAFRSSYLYLFNHLLLSHSIMFDSLPPHGLLRARLLCDGISQARILEWGAIFFCRGSSWHGVWIHISCRYPALQMIRYVKPRGIPFSHYFNSKYQPKLPATPRFFLRLYVCFEIAIVYQLENLNKGSHYLLSTGWYATGRVIKWSLHRAVSLLWIQYCWKVLTPLPGAASATRNINSEGCCMKCNGGHDVFSYL